MASRWDITNDLSFFLLMPMRMTMIHAHIAAAACCAVNARVSLVRV